MSEQRSKTTAEQGRFVLLPGMHGTGDLFGSFVDALPAGADVSVASYPGDQKLSYGELDTYVRAAVPKEPYVLVAESFSGPLAVAHAASHPSRLRALVLCATFVSNPVPRILRWTRYLPSTLAFVFSPPSAAVRALLTGPDGDPQIVDAVKAATRHVRPSVRHGTSTWTGVRCRRLRVSRVGKCPGAIPEWIEGSPRWIARFETGGTSPP